MGEELKERLGLTLGRVREIQEEKTEGAVPAYLREAASFICHAGELLRRNLSEGEWTFGPTGAEELSLRELSDHLWKEATEEGYAGSVLDPDAAAARLPEELAGPLCFLRTELLAMIPAASE